MLSLADILWLLGTAAAAVALVFVVRWRRRTHGAYVHQLAQERVCSHLRPALELLIQRGHRVRRVGQRDRDLPLEIHLQPPFDPAAIFQELKLAEPVFVSERNVLYCKEHWCEIHPSDG
jgi:hypothetical protein